MLTNSFVQLHKDYQPEWWKKEKVRIDHRGRIVQSIRSCPAMNDWLTMGYYIVATQDIPVRNGLHWDYLMVEKDFKHLNLTISFHLHILPHS